MTVSEFGRGKKKRKKKLQQSLHSGIITFFMFELSFFAVG